MNIATIFSFVILFAANSLLQAAPVKVELKQANGKYRLHVNGKEFFVKGAGCEFGNIEKLGQHGANSFRTWRTENGRSSGQEILDRAQKAGLLVLMGLELIPDRRGFDYNDTAAVAKQFASVKEQVLKYKDHPALLGWLIGNELNLFYKNPKVWDAVNDVAKFIHEVDPNHPAATALAGIGKEAVDEIKKRAPALDFITVQFYADIVNLQKRLQDAGWTGPYIVTEWGATGHWEVPTTEWKAPIEETSSMKAKAFAERYQKAILADPDRCLGSYVFLWGQKQERTPTWYGMFTQAGEEMETVDVMHEIWNGKPPANRTPQLRSITLNGKTPYQNARLKPEEPISAVIDAADPDGDAIQYVFEIMPESTDLGTGGDFETTPPVLSTLKSDKGTMALKAPAKEGAYRLFFYAKDGKGHCGTGNIPFFVGK
ncbi:MAG: hypothetical protein EHM61_19980 [Acidobacteria bacterium]|nr:MAG: hypothetical protein EHM61_19980 [Acidobacteriota bacterium]